MQNLIERIGTHAFFQITIESWNEVFLFMMISSLLIGVYHDRKDKSGIRTGIPMTKELITFYSAVLVYNFCNVIEIIFKGRQSFFASVILRCGIFVYYAVGGFLTIFFLQVVKNQIARKKGIKKLEKALLGLQLLQIPMFLLLISTPFTNVLYIINDSNIYTRSWGYTLWQNITVLTLTFIIIVVIIQWNSIDHMLQKVIMTATFIPIIGIIIGYYLSMNINNIIVAVTAYILFILYEHKRTEVSIRNMYELEKAKALLVKNELLLEQSRNQTLMAQIQPHFINNSLMALRSRCAEYPEIYDSITNFSLYLRSHFDALGDTKTISFEQEMTNIEAYLALEQLNYQDRLNVEYDIQYDDFMIPALTVQPLVENAVRHGIGTYEKGGTVKISTRLDQDNIIIEVTDDGQGKTNITSQQEKRKGIGIENVRARVRSISQGELELITLEHGTAARITIRNVRTDS